MKRRSLAWLLVLGLAAVAVHMAPLAVRAEEMATDRKSAPAGVTTILYAGQTFRVNSTALVHLHFELLSPTSIKISFASDDGLAGKMSIYWVNFQKYIYVGVIPIDPPWEGTLETEGGFVDR